MNFTKTLVASALIIAAGVAQAELTANIGATSNYLWRGVTQTGDEAAVSGGLDYSHDSGFYAGTWASSLGGGQYELDLYAGVAGEMEGFTYDIGYYYYAYPLDVAGVDPELDFGEISASIGMGAFGLQVAFTTNAEDDAADEDSVYVAATGDFELSDGFGLGLVVGNYSGDDIEAAFGDSYTHYGAFLSKSDFTFGLEANDTDDDDLRATVSWGMEF